MWQRFTESAQKVVLYAQQEAGRLGENYVSTEHLLLGLVRESADTPAASVWPPPPSPLPPLNSSGRETAHAAALVLQEMGVRLADVCAEVERRLKPGPGRNGEDMQLTPRAKRVIDLAYDEARSLNGGRIDTQYLLLGLIREEKGLAGRVLADLGVTLDRPRQEIVRLQGGGLPPAPDAPPRRAWWHRFRP